MTFPNASLFPITTEVTKTDHLSIGGCDLSDLANQFGTPLYIFDEATLRDMCRQFVKEFTSRYENTKVLYASKAYTNVSIANIIHQEGLGIDVVSGGELAVALAAKLPCSQIYFHGNNKSVEELTMAINNNIGKIVIDSFHELDLVNKIAANNKTTQEVMLRLSPGIDPHTHAKTTTGILDSKFGFSIETGDAKLAILETLSKDNIDLVGIHFHLGSPIFELEPYSTAIDTVLTFLSDFKKDGLNLREFSPGGGFAIGYVQNQLPPDISSYAEVITSTLNDRATQLGFEDVTLTIEPGRSIVGRAGVALYRVGGIKDIPTIRKYVSLDGGMGDNIRPALYDSQYEAVVANRISDKPEEIVTLAGKYCESGDLLIKDICLPKLNTGDLIAIPSSGAYAPSMASNYNLNPRPAIVIVKEGNPRLIRRRETYEDMMALDIQ